MLNDCKKEYTNSANAKGETFTTESLFMTLIFEQQKMINELITKLQHTKHVNNEDEQ
jgi:hypothetical protein